MTVRIERLWAAVLAAVVVVLLGQARAEAAADKVALVIGNSAYAHVARLQNPQNDASDVAEALRNVGFTVKVATNLDERGMRAALREFEPLASASSVALVYYAGHGIEVNGVNYLIPVDAALKRDTYIQDEAVPLSRVLETIAMAKTLRMVLLDACRDNPFIAQMERTNSGRSISRGLARVEPTAATIVSFAAAEGATASDGDGRNSPFARALLNHIATPGLEVKLVLGRASNEVRQKSQGKQVPAVYWTPGGEEVYLVNAPAPTTPQVAEDPAADYLLAQKVNTVAAWDAFLARYPKGFQSELARAARAELEAKSRAPADQLAAAERTDTRSPSEIAPEEAYWRTIRTSVVPEDFRGYLRRYPSGLFADLAKARIEALKRAGAVNAALTGDPAQADKAMLRKAAMARVETMPKTLVQYGLVALGYPVKSITGVLDADTRRAVRQYQASVNEPQTGTLTAQQTVDLLLAAAAAGDPRAQTAVGYMTASGVGLERDYGIARLWFTKAADQSEPFALANLGVMVRDGLGGPRDPQQAAQYIAKAESRGIRLDDVTKEGLVVR
jgi:uncharacterized caspase-like protein